MQFFTFLHIVSMFAAVTVFHAMLWIVVYATRQRSVGALRVVARIWDRADAVGGILLFLGIGFGIAAALTGGVDLAARWLVSAYVILGIGAVAVFVGQRYTTRLRAAVGSNPDDEPSPELSLLMASRWPLMNAMAAATVIVLVIAVMVFKPTF